jgi:alkylhydroperoxidase family enzyme
MPVLLEDIQWSKPFIPPLVDKALEKKTKKMLPPGPYPEVYRLIAHRRWLLEISTVLLARPLVVDMPLELPPIINLIACQENSCRFCYGAQKAGLRLMGYDESDLRKLELDIYEGDEKMRVLADFVRALSRSNPRPAKREYDALKEAGYSDNIISEVVFKTTVTCFNNRFATLAAAPPMTAIEDLSTSFFSRLVRPIYKAAFKPKKVSPSPDFDTSGFLGELIDPVRNHPGAKWLRDAIDYCFDSDMISRETKLLMLGVLAKALSCEYCMDASCGALRELGKSAEEISHLLENLGAGSPGSETAHLLQWVRKTIRYIPIQVQNDTKDLMEKIGVEKTVEAIGVAAVINMLARLAMLRQQ